MNYRIIIPARYASSRLPGKPLRLLGGLPMLQRTWQQACKSRAEAVVIATDDERIMALAKQIGADACLTRRDHPSGTARLAEVIDARHWPDDTLVVNLQGDEPLMPPALLDQVANNLAEDRNADAATLAEALTNPEERDNPHVVKVVCDAQSHALYFSRAAIPHTADHGQGDSSLYQRHVGLYAYRARTIRRYIQLAPCALEHSEQLEQLRLLYHGLKLRVTAPVEPTLSASTPKPKPI